MISDRESEDSVTGWLSVTSPVQASSSVGEEGVAALAQKWAWFGGTAWSEDKALYEVEAANPRCRTADFLVHKTIFRKRTSTPIYIDRTNGTLVYGDKGKWYAQEATHQKIVWVEVTTERISNIWIRKPIEEKQSWASRQQSKAKQGESAAILGESVAVAEREWTKYQDPASRRYWWWCHIDSRWFFDDDKAWKQYQDPDSKRIYRWHSESEDWFYEDSGGKV